MKHLYPFAFAILATSAFHGGVGAQTTHNLATGSSSFSPSLLTIQLGDIVNINVGPGHTCTEVTQATWNANGSTPNGGFNYSPGTHQLVPTVPGTYYYVCQVHVSMGMKGRIIVEAGTGVAESGTAPSSSIAPNPAGDELLVNADPAMAFVSLIDAQGREVLRHKVQGNDRIAISHLAEGAYTVAWLDARGVIREQKRLNIVR